MDHIGPDGELLRLAKCLKSQMIILLNGPLGRQCLIVMLYLISDSELVAECRYRYKKGLGRMDKINVSFWRNFLKYANNDLQAQENC